MRGQPGFFDIDERLRDLSAQDDALERLAGIVAYSDEAGRRFRFEAGRHSEAKPVTGPI